METTIEITDKEYQENRIKIYKEKTIWDTYTEENVSPDDLIARVNQAKEEILNNGLGADEDSMYLDTYRYDIGAELNLNWMQFETKSEYIKRILSEKSSYDCKIARLTEDIENNFEDVCKIVEKIKKDKENECKRYS